MPVDIIIEAIRAAIASGRITQTKLADAAGLESSTVGRILKGETSPRAKTRDRLVAAFQAEQVGSVGETLLPTVPAAHLTFVANWAASTTIQSMVRSKLLQQVFVPVPIEDGSIATLAELAAAQGNFIITAPPGSGKTTSQQIIAATALAKYEATGESPPIVLLLRDIRPGDSIIAAIRSILGLQLRAGTQQAGTGYIVSTIDALNQLRAVVLLDGLDEVAPAMRNDIVREIQQLLLHARHYRVVLTVRTGEDFYTFDNAEKVRLGSFSNDQARMYATAFLGRERANAFLSALSCSRVAGAARRPLILASLCALYERNGELPSRPIDVYEMIVSLFIEEWDRQRGILRISAFSNFSWRRKERFFQAVAYELARMGIKGTFIESDLASVYSKVAPDFGLPVDELRSVLREMVAHTGLIVESGYRQYTFMHLSIQEFLAAMHAVRLVDPELELVPRLPNETALVIAYATDPRSYLERVIETLVEREVSSETSQFVAALLGQFASERPYWRPSARLGWSFIACLDILSRFLGQDVHAAHLQLAGDLLCAMGGDVFKSVHHAIAESEVSFGENGVRVLPKPTADLPLADTAHFLDRSRRGFQLSLPARLVDRLVA